MPKNIIILMDDVHLEGRPPETQQEFADKINEKINHIKLLGNNPIVICAGDIGEGIAGIQWASQFKCEVIYICGNHEYWGGDFYEVPKSLKEFASLPENKHIHFLEKNVCIINGIRFIGATLWASLGNFLPWYNKNYVIRFFSAMGDFKRTTAKAWYTEENTERLKKYLTFNGLEEEKFKEIIENKNYNPLIEIEENKKSVEFFIEKLSEHFIGETIVISHHLPMYQLWMKKMNMLPENLSGENCNNERFFLDCAKGNTLPSKDTLMMAFYVNDLEDLMYSQYAPNYWLHGHLHQTMEDIVGKTKIISSPVGYHRQSKEMKYKEIIIDKNPKFLREYLIKEINSYSWNNKLYETIRSLEKIIVKFELGVSMGILDCNDFQPILLNYQITHENNLKELKVKVNEWLKILLYSSNTKIFDKEIDNFLVKKAIGFSDSKYKFPEILAAGINEHSFVSLDKFKLIYPVHLPFNHYKEWLKELQKIQIQISQYKRSLIEFCEEFTKK